MILLIHPGAAGERHERWISAMLWSEDISDPRLVQAESFRSLADLGVWLAGIVAQHPGAISIKWTGDLLAEPDMVRTVATALQVDPPPPGRL